MNKKREAGERLDVHFADTVSSKSKVYHGNQIRKEEKRRRKMRFRSVKWIILTFLGGVVGTVISRVIISALMG